MRQFLFLVKVEPFVLPLPEPFWLPFPFPLPFWSRGGGTFSLGCIEALEYRNAPGHLVDGLFESRAFCMELGDGSPYLLISRD